MEFEIVNSCIPFTIFANFSLEKLSPVLCGKLLNLRTGCEYSFIEWIDWGKKARAFKTFVSKLHNNYLCHCLFPDNWNT